MILIKYVLLKNGIQFAFVMEAPFVLLYTEELFFLTRTFLHSTCILGKKRFEITHWEDQTELHGKKKKIQQGLFLQRFVL